MALNVFTNVSSLNAQRYLLQTQQSMTRSLQRLASGQRINTAADDAAGLAISNGLRAQANGMAQASRNAGDGLSLLATAESGLTEQSGILQRLRELAVQAASDSNNQTNRDDLNGEASQLKAELERIARTTSFNGQNLLDGSFQGKDIQVGANTTANDRINLGFESCKAADLGAITTTTSGSTTDYTRTSTLPLGGYRVSAPGDFTLTVGGIAYNVGPMVNDGVSPNGMGYASISALAAANAINLIQGQTGVTATATTSYTNGGYNQKAGTINSGDLMLNGVDVGPVTVTNSTDTSVLDAINNVKNLTGVTASKNGSNEIVLTAADGRNIEFSIGASARACGFVSGGVIMAGAYTLHSTNDFTVGGAHPDDGGVAAGPATQVSTPTTTTTTATVSTIDLSSKAGAQLAIQIADKALGQLNSRRANIGALTNRLGSTISNLNAAAENAWASNSRILDADFAVETAAMQRSTILQQAGIAILSQANQGPQMILSLLR